MDSEYTKEGDFQERGNIRMPKTETTDQKAHHTGPTRRRELAYLAKQ